MKNLNINANKIGQIINADQVNIDQRKIDGQKDENKDTREEKKEEKKKIVISAKASKAALMGMIEKGEASAIMSAVQKYSLSPDAQTQFDTIKRDFEQLRRQKESASLSIDEYELHLSSIKHKLRYWVELHME